MADMNLTISQDLIKPIIAAKIQAAIVAAMGNEHAMVEAAVVAALNLKTDRNGKVSQYESENKFTLLEGLCYKGIQDAAKAALIQHMQEAQPLVLAAMKKEIAKNTNKIAIAMVDALVNKTKSEYSFSFKIELDKN